MRCGARRACISIPIVILDTLPLGEQEHMWINDDTTWTLTAQRHRLSSDVMQLSSLGESVYGEKGGKRCEQIITGLIPTRLNISEQWQRPVTKGFYLWRPRQNWHFLDVHFKQLANWEINLQPSALRQGSLCKCHVQRLAVTSRVIWMI